MHSPIAEVSIDVDSCIPFICMNDGEEYHTTFSHIREYKFNIKLSGKHWNKLLESLSS